MRAWIALAVTMAAASTDQPTQGGPASRNVTKANSAITITTHRSGTWLIHRTPNFRVCARDMNADYRELAETCEALRTQLQATWFGKVSESTWSPRCDIIVHASLYEYQQALGRSVGRSVGCATLKLDGERIVGRRIDIRADADNWEKDALPHELTHVVLADRFAGRRIPHWADEGMGVLAESETKQARRFEALKLAAARRTIYHGADLLELKHLPRRDYRDAFYAQSAILVRTLLACGAPEQFVAFLHQATEHGYDHALQNVYGIPDVEQLLTLYKSDLSTARPPIWKQAQPTR